MINQIVVVGRIHKIGENNSLTIACPDMKKEKNENNEYDCDYIDFKLNDNIYSSVKEYCSINDVVGIKGRVTSTGLEAEKVSFLTSTSKEG